MKHPIQPLARDADGTLRFKENSIVRHLLDSHPTHDMNTLAAMVFSRDDWQQFAQLIGYSLSGYGELRSYVDDDAFNAAEKMSGGVPEAQARVDALQFELDAVRLALREPMARLFGVHPDDLSSGAGDASDIIRDATRYRWLRDQHWSESNIAVVRDPMLSVRPGYSCPSDELLDELIDAAIAIQREKEL